MVGRSLKCEYTYEEKYLRGETGLNLKNLSVPRINRRLWFGFHRMLVGPDASVALDSF